MADTPSPPSPEILEKLRQLREELAQKAAQQAPKDANTLAWQQSNAFKRIYPRANGGEIRRFDSGGSNSINIDELSRERAPTIPEQFNKYIAPHINRGMDAMFPLRRLIQNKFETNVFDPINNAVMNDPHSALQSMGAHEGWLNQGKQHIENTARKLMGKEPLPSMLDAKKALGDINEGEFDRQYVDMDIRHAKRLEEFKRQQAMGRAKGGVIDMDRMRLELMNGKKKFLEHSKVKHPVYHGTMSGNIKEFKTPAYFGSKEVANQFADPEYLYGTSKLEEGEHPNVMPVHLNLKNPKVFTKEEDYEKHVMDGGLDSNHWIKKGYDGIVYAPHGDIKHPDAYYVAFHPHQIKSAIGNRGTYDINDPDITKKNGGITHAHHLDIEERPL